MPRVHRRTTLKAKTSSKDMKEALILIQKGKSIRETAKTSNILYATLCRYWKKIFVDENIIQTIIFKEYSQMSKS